MVLPLFDDLITSNELLVERKARVILSAYYSASNYSRTKLSNRVFSTNQQQSRWQVSNWTHLINYVSLFNKQVTREFVRMDFL